MVHKICFARIAVVEYSADLAHLVERDLAKVEVAGSSPVIRSIFLFFAIILTVLFLSDQMRYI